MSLLTNGPHTCSIYTRSETTDASGGQVVAYTLRDSDVRTLIRSATSNEKLKWLQQNVVCTHVAMGTHSDWRTGDKVVSNSDSYRVTGIGSQQGVGGIPSFKIISLEESK